MRLLLSALVCGRASISVPTGRVRTVSELSMKYAKLQEALGTVKSGVPGSWAGATNHDGRTFLPEQTWSGVVLARSVVLATFPRTMVRPSL